MFPSKQGERVALHDDLLDQANHLALRERRKPKQASLRRAVSAAYYALFHLLVSEGATLMPAKPTNLRQQARRAFVHGDMKTVCKQFAHGALDTLQNETKKLVGMPLENELASVARAFVDLQEERHRADYDTSTPFIRLEVRQKVDLARQAFDKWNAIRDKPNATVFLAALLLQRHWNK